MDASKSDRLTIREAAAELRLSRDVVYSMAAAGEIDHYRIRGRIFISREGIAKLLKANFYPAHRSFFHRKSALRTQTSARVS
ncbi:MAG: helix-turn-helix domain-containing protein [Acidobacteriota bacterium]